MGNIVKEITLMTQAKQMVAPRRRLALMRLLPPKPPPRARPPSY